MRMDPFLLLLSPFDFQREVLKRALTPVIHTAPVTHAAKRQVLLSPGFSLFCTRRISRLLPGKDRFSDQIIPPDGFRRCIFRARLLSEILSPVIIPMCYKERPSFRTCEA